MQRLTIGNHELYVNPEEVAISSRSNVVVQKTKGGEVTQIFQADDEIITISGTTADAGLRELQALQKAIEPGVHLAFSYPYKKMARTVRVTSCVYTDSVIKPNLYQYRIELMTERPQTASVAALPRSTTALSPVGSLQEVAVAYDGESISDIIRRASKKTYSDYGQYEQAVKNANPEIKDWWNLKAGTKVRIP